MTDQPQKIRVSDGHNLTESRYDYVFDQETKQTEVFDFVEGR